MGSVSWVRIDHQPRPKGLHKMAKNPAGKARKSDKPYLTIEGFGWTWKVLKFWQADGRKPYARAFCDVSSPMTFGGSDMGDTYVSDLRDAFRMGATVTQMDGITVEEAVELLGVQLDGVLA